MDWWGVMKDGTVEGKIKEIELIINDIKENKFYDETVRLSNRNYTSRITNELLEGKIDAEEAAEEMMKQGVDRKYKSLWFIDEELRGLRERLNRYPILLEELVKKHAKLSSHPDWDSEMLDSEWGGYYGLIKNIFKGIEEGKINETTPVEYFVDLLADSPIRAECIQDIWQYINNAPSQMEHVYLNLSKQRSMGLFESMAETMGVEIKYGSRRPNPTHGGKPKFTHGGLDFQIFGKSELEIHAGDNRVSVCIVSNNPNLPIGDYYATLLGLIVARPNELDVLDFAIRLANIFKEYNDFLANLELRIYDVDVFTPFRKSNSENKKFENLIETLSNAETDFSYFSVEETRPAGEMLEKIKNALIDVFGDTRGFF